MDITNINLDACPLQYLSIGYVGETGARPVSFNFSAWATEYGAGVLQLLLQRPGDANPYPVVLNIDGTTATWTPDATATEKTGQGQAQLVYTVGGVVVKNAIFRVLIAPSLGAAGDPPEPYEDWLERLLTIAAEAQQSAIDAAGSAEAAGTSAGAAAGSAVEAEQSAGDAAAAKTDAETAKTAAETAATAAGVSAGSAAEKAAQAAQSAQTAGQGASAAQQSATDAQAALEAAQLAADAAGTFADDAEESKTAAALSAAGAAQAKTDAETAATDAAASAASAAASAAVAQELIDQIPDIEAEIDTKAPAIYKTAGPAAVVTVTDGAEDMPIKTLTVNIEPQQDLHGYDNPWPVGGGKNKLDYTVAWSGVPYNAGVGTVFTLVEPVSQPTVRGDTVTFTTTSGWAGRAWKTPILAAGSYTVHLDVSQTSNSRMSIYTVDGTTNAVKTAYASTSSSVFSRAVSVDDGDYIIVSEASSTAGTITVKSMQVESGVSYTAWTPYSNICPISGWDAVSIRNKPTYDTGADPTVTIQLGQTVYGGTLDVAAGTLMVDRWYLTKANASQVKYYFTATPPRVEMLFEGGKFANADSQVNAFSSMYQSTTGVQDKRMRLYRTEIDIYDTNFTDQAATDAILADFIAVYKLRTPITIDLDPVTVSTILGTNNIWADTGDVTVEYAADTKSYIDAQAAALSVEIDALEAAQPKTVTVTGTTPVIAAVDNTRYKCGEVSTLDITLPASGIVDVVFTSGTTPTVLTVTPPTGVTVKWANGFDPDSLEADTTYEINICDGLGVAASWT